MTKSEQLREYQRALVLACVHRSKGLVTAGDLTELAGSLAQAELHPRECWIGINTQSITGNLRTLQNEGFVVKLDVRKNVRYGRDEPAYGIAGGQHLANPNWPIPEPPEAMEEEALAMPVLPVDPMHSMTREQLLAVIQVRDDMLDLTQRTMREIQALADRAQRALSVHA